MESLFENEPDNMSLNYVMECFDERVDQETKYLKIRALKNLRPNKPLCPCQDNCTCELRIPREFLVLQKAQQQFYADLKKEFAK